MLFSSRAIGSRAVCNQINYTAETRDSRLSTSQIRGSEFFLGMGFSQRSGFPVPFSTTVFSSIPQRTQSGAQPKQDRRASGLFVGRGFSQDGFPMSPHRRSM